MVEKSAIHLSENLVLGVGHCEDRSDWGVRYPKRVLRDENTGEVEVGNLSVDLRGSQGKILVEETHSLNPS